MKKSLIALAVAGAIAAPVAMADSNVVVYGQMNLSADSVKNGNVTNGKISSNTSRLGVKGSEDLGDGVSAVWQIESLIQADGGASGGTSTLATRNTFAGLSGGFGTVLAGRHDTPYKISTRKLDVFGDNIADNRSLMGGAGVPSTGALTGVSAGASFDGRQPDVIAYVSPAMGGLTIAAGYVVGAETATAASKKGNAYSLAAMFGQDAFYAALAYESHKLGSFGSGTVGVPVAALNPLAGQTESATKVGVGYSTDAMSLGLAYEKTKDNFGAAGANLLGHSAYYASGKFNFGSNAAKIAYAKAGNLGASASTGASQVSVGLDHNFTKRTVGYALYTQLSNQASASYGLGATGYSTSATGPASAAGAKVSALSVGVKHSF